MEWKTIYMGMFEEEIDIYRSFHVAPSLYNVAVAYYGDEGYDGDAKVLLYKGPYGPLAKKKFNFYFVSGGHCSCHGLEDQWQPDEVSEEWLWLQVQEHAIKKPKPDYDYHMQWEFWKNVGQFLEQASLHGNT
jgi:hypothetical protein